MMDRPHPSPMDSAVVLSILGLIALGLITLARIGLPPSAGMDSQIVRQSVFVLVGISLFTMMAYLDYRAVGMIAWVLFAVSVLLLVLVLFFGVTRYGAQRWFLAGPLQFQPSELAKFTEIILLARFFAKYRGEPIKLRIFALSRSDSSPAYRAHSFAARLRHRHDFLRHLVRNRLHRRVADYAFGRRRSAFDRGRAARLVSYEAVHA